MQLNIAATTTHETNAGSVRTASTNRASRPRRLALTEWVILSVAVLCVVAVALYPSIRTRATSWPSTVTIKVNEAETLWGIAKSHPIKGLSTAETVAAIRNNNGLPDSGLQQGQLLKVPGEVEQSAAMASR